MQLSCLSSQTDVSPQNDVSLVEQSRDHCQIPGTCIFTCHLSESSLPVKLLERNYYGGLELCLETGLR